MTEEQILARLNLTPAERMMVRHCVMANLRAGEYVKRGGKGVGKGRPYQGTKAWEVLEKAVPDPKRWAQLTYGVMDICRLRRGEHLCRAWHVSDVRDAA